MSAQPLIENPIDKDNEALILSNAIQDDENRNIFVRSVSYDKFRLKEFKVIAWGLIEAVKDNLDINADVILLKSKSCPIHNNIEFNFIKQLTENFSVVSPQNYKKHIELLTTDATKHNMIEWVIRSVLPACTDSKTTVSELESKLEYGKAIIDKGVSLSRSEFKSMEEVAKEYDENKRLGVSKRTTGFHQLDMYLTEGFKEGQITTIAGLSSVGKSSMALTIMKNLSQMQNPTPVAQFALEMNNMSIFSKFLAFRTQLPISTIIKKPEDLLPEELEVYEYEKSKLAANKHIYLTDNPSQSVASIREQIMLLQERLKQEYIVVVVDLFGKLKDLQGSTNFARDYEKKLNEIQVLVRELQVHMILVAQINREVSRRKDTRPTMNDLKNAHALTEVSDVMLGVHRPYHDPELALKNQMLSYGDALDDDEEDDCIIEDDPNKNIAELIILKQRMGPKDILLNFIFDPITTCFYPITADYQKKLNQMKLEDES